MNELLLNIISVIVSSILIPLITYLGLKLSTYLKTKTNNAKLQTMIDSAINSVALSVACISQTFVDSLKASGNFTKEAQNQAFKMAKEKALQLINEEGKNAIKTLYGDFNEWLEAQIEAKVQETKKV